jgi:CRISPR-associated protein Cas1
VVLDGSGSLSFDVLDWLAGQGVPLIRIGWRGQVQAVLGGSGYGVDLDRLTEQLTAKRNGGALRIATNLIGAKIDNSIETLHCAVPRSLGRDHALAKLESDAAGLRTKSPSSIKELLGIEGRVAYTYFEAWHGLPIRWKGTGRKPIPPTWRYVERRSSVAKQKITNRNASHPVNAMLNYAYAILESNVRIQIATEGYDPNIGYLHAQKSDRPALVFDLMEPLRPIVDRKILEFLQERTFHPADFTIRSDGVCRLNPEMAKHVVALSILGAYKISNSIHGNWPDDHPHTAVNDAIMEVARRGS